MNKGLGPSLELSSFNMGTEAILGPEHLRQSVQDGILTPLTAWPPRSHLFFCSQVHPNS